MRRHQQRDEQDDDWLGPDDWELREALLDVLSQRPSTRASRNLTVLFFLPMLFITLALMVIVPITLIGTLLAATGNLSLAQYGPLFSQPQGILLAGGGLTLAGFLLLRAMKRAIARAKMS